LHTASCGQVQLVAEPLEDLDDFIGVVGVFLLPATGLRQAGDDFRLGSFGLLFAPGMQGRGVARRILA
jgi:GNAT superfamily N-acetyltransferase